MPAHRRRLEVAAAVALVIGSAGIADRAAAEVIHPDPAIGTKVQHGGFDIDTRVESITVSEPAVVDVPGGPAYEVRGTVSGIGWGGAGVVARASSKHYRYVVPFVVRWLPRASNTLVVFHHGGGPPVAAVLARDKLRGAANGHRFAELVGDEGAGVATLANGYVYAAMNRRGMLIDGTLSAKYLPEEVPPLTAEEAASINATLERAPGDPSYRSPDIEAGAPVPASIATDTATFRDVDRAIQLVAARVTGRAFRHRLSIGTSTGAMVTAGMAFGRSAIGADSVRTGGNYLVPYVPSSGSVFDGFVFNGFVYNSDTPRADEEHPIAAPIMFIQGRADERYQQPIHMLDELAEKLARQGVVTLDGKAWLYEVKSMSHVTRDAPFEVALADQTGERLATYAGAALHNLRELLAEGKAPPTSRIAGRIVNGALVIDVADGGVETVAPILEDPDVDWREADPMVVVRPIGPAETARWQRVTAILDHEPDAITGPVVACRLGGLGIKFFGQALQPFPPEVLDALFGGFGGYRECVDATVERLAAQRLYDPRAESVHETAERARSLFP